MGTVDWDAVGLWATRVVLALTIVCALGILWRLLAELIRASLELYRMTTGRVYGYPMKSSKQKLWAEFLRISKGKNTRSSFKLEEQIGSYIDIEDQSHQSCAVCLDDYEDEEKQDPSMVPIGILKTCGHHYHFECVWTWLEKSGKCPLCRNCVKLSQNDIGILSLQQYKDAKLKIHNAGQGHVASCSVISETYAKDKDSAATEECNCKACAASQHTKEECKPLLSQDPGDKGALALNRSLSERTTREEKSSAQIDDAEISRVKVHSAPVNIRDGARQLFTNLNAKKSKRRNSC